MKSFRVSLIVLASKVLRVPLKIREDFGLPVTALCSAEATQRQEA